MSIWYGPFSDEAKAYRTVVWAGRFWVAMLVWGFIELMLFRHYPLIIATLLAFYSFTSVISLLFHVRDSGLNYGYMYRAIGAEILWSVTGYLQIRAFLAISTLKKLKKLEFPTTT